MQIRIFIKPKKQTEIEATFYEQHNFQDKREDSPLDYSRLIITAK
jgi:hypothetical protein